MIEKLRTSIDKAEEYLLALMLAALISAGLLQVILRNLFDTGILWNESLIRILVLWLTLIGSITATRGNRHIKINILDRLLADYLLPYWQVLLNLVSAAVCSAVAYYSYGFVLEEFNYGEIAFGTVPVWLTEAIIPVGFGLMAIRFLLMTFGQSKSNQEQL